MTMQTDKPAPKLVTIGRNGEIKLESKCDLAAWTIQELTRRAMNDVGKYIIKNVRLNVEKAFPFTIRKKGKKGHRLSERYQYWVRKRETDLILGIENKKKGAVTAWWADQLELDQFIPTHKGGQKPGPRGKDGDGNGVSMKYVMSGRYKKGRTKGHGTSFQPRRHLLEKFVKSHINEIVLIESQYLEYMNDESAAMAAIAETAGKEINE